MSVVFKVELKGSDDSARTLQAVRDTLADGTTLHARIATDALRLTKDYLLSTPRHNTATRLGASPTGFRERSARRITSRSTADEAVLVIPRDTGLGRAFSDVVIRPGSGRTYLTIPANKRSYGKSVRDFPEDALKFAILRAHRPFPVLMFKDTGEVAYWLRRSVKQTRDRSLLPSDEAFQKLAAASAQAQLASTIYNS